MNTDFLTPLTSVVTDLNSKITALTASIGTVDCLAGTYGTAAAGAHLQACCATALLSTVKAGLVRSGLLEALCCERLWLRCCCQEVMAKWHFD